MWKQDEVGILCLLSPHQCTFSRDDGGEWGVGGGAGGGAGVGVGVGAGVGAGGGTAQCAQDVARTPANVAKHIAHVDTRHNHLRVE